MDRNPGRLTRDLARRPPPSRGTAAAATILVGVLLATAGCASRQVPDTGAATPLVGLASWYGREFDGRRTASGERFDMNRLTAAHRTLPFNTRVRVTNLENGRSVEVRINDRGPFVEGRIIDLSYRAARKIGMVKPGLARVRLEVLD